MHFRDKNIEIQSISTQILQVIDFLENVLLLQNHSVELVTDWADWIFQDFIATYLLRLVAKSV